MFVTCSFPPLPGWGEQKLKTTCAIVSNCVCTGRKNKIKMLKIFLSLKENVSGFLSECLPDEHLLYFYMVTVLYLVRIEANLQVNYVSD